MPDAELYSVGGRVRDEVLAEIGRPQPRPADADYLVAKLPLPEIIARLKPYGRTEVVGASFGVIKFTRDSTTVDIALPRKERSTGRHHRDFEIQSSPDIPVQEDLVRRDFRINMMARRLGDGQLVDPFGGRDDLLHQRLDIVKDEVFEEDPLRILRGAQLAARFALQPTPRTMEAMRGAAELIPTVAAERASDELTKLFTRSAKPSMGIELLRESGALTFIMPELIEGWGVEQNEFHRYTVYYHSLRCCDETAPELVLRLAALLHDVGKPRTKSGPHFYRHELVGEDMVRKMLARLKFPTNVVDEVARLVKHHMFASDDSLSDAAVRRFISRVGLDLIERLFALRRADIVASGLPERNPAELDRFSGRVYQEVHGPSAFGLRDLQIDGAQVIALMRQMGLAPEGFQGDARVGAVLRYCLDAVLEEPRKNTPQALLEIAREFLSRGEPQT